MLGQHDSLVAASMSLRPGERLAAFLDDLYMWSRRSSGQEVATGEDGQLVSVAANFGKTLVYRAAGGPAPRNLGANVWRSDLRPEQCGFVALGVPDRPSRVRRSSSRVTICPNRSYA